MPTTVKDKLGFNFHESEIVGSPQIFASETVVAGADDDWAFYWTLNAGDVGKAVYALPDVAIIGDGGSTSFLNDEVVWGEISVYQHYSRTDLSTGDVTTGFQRLASGDLLRDQVLAQQYASFQPFPGTEGNASNYLKIVVPALRQDTTEFGIQYDYDDSLILEVTANNGILDDIGVNDPHAGRFLVTTNSPGGERAAGLGGGWIDILTTGGQPPSTPDGEVPPEIADEVATLNDIAGKSLDAASVLSSANDITKLASTYFDEAETLRLQGIELGYHQWEPLIGRSEEFDDYLGKIDPNVAESRLSKIIGVAGTAIDVLEAGQAAMDKYQEHNDLKAAFKTGSIKFVAAYYSGQIGTVVGGSTAIWLAGAGGAALASTGLPIIAGIAAGYFVGEYIAKPAIEASATWAIDLIDNTVNGPPPRMLSERAASTPPKWSYNIKTKEFKWLDPAAEKKYALYATLLDVNPNPVKLKLVGDKFADKNDLLLGHGASDTIKGKSGNDILFGAKGSDDIRGGGGNDILHGGASNDKLTASNGDDFLFGNGGKDTLVGGLGLDVMVGGKGKDVFVFQSTLQAGLGDTSDMISDFKQGQDKIDLRKIDADLNTPGDQAFSLRNLSAATHSDGPVPITYVYGDVNGDGAADFSFRLKGITTVYLSDLML